MGPLGSERLVRGLWYVAFVSWPIEKEIPAINCLRLDTRFNVITEVK